MKITKKLCYGVDENTPKELLYVKRIILRNYKEPEKVKTFMELISNFKIYQYNYDNSKDSDYFLWQYVNDKGKEDWKSVDLCCYQDNMESVYKMWTLYEICKTTYTGIEVEVQFDNIENLVNKIKEEVLENE